MWPNSQETANLVTFTEEILNENFILYAVWAYNAGYKIFIEPSQIQNLLINAGNCKTLQNKNLRH